MTASDQSLVPCPACQAVLPVSIQQLGQQVRCGKCHEVFQTPARPKVIASEPPDEDNPFAIPTSLSSRSEESDDDREPVPRRRETPAT
jgi:predicted Zn finger-like uncharacterized protein